MRAFQGSTHDLHISGTIKAIVHTPLGQSASNVLLNRFVNLRGVDTVGGSQLLCDCEFFGIEVHANDLCSSDLEVSE